MNSRPILISDFDGVIVDGIAEYWCSARAAFIEISKDKRQASSLQKNVPNDFVQLRAWVTYGWEMVVLAAELSRSNSPLTKLQESPEATSAQYEISIKEAMGKWGWEANQLQEALETVRKEAIKLDRSNWIALHNAFPYVIKRFNYLNYEGCDLVVLTTKSAEFTNELLSSFSLKPKIVFGHESGSKVDVIHNLSKKYKIHGFIEDRRATLENIKKNPLTNKIPCFLASWGYLKKHDSQNLPLGIKLLDKQKLATPLASWN